MPQRTRQAGRLGKKSADMTRLAQLAQLAMVALTLILCRGGAVAQSGVHGDGHAANHDQYRNWSTHSGASCCKARVEREDGQITGDCRPTHARYMTDHWEAWNGDMWLYIPAEAMAPYAQIPAHTEDGRSHLCEVNGYVYCFVPAEPRS